MIKKKKTKIKLHFIITRQIWLMSFEPRDNDYYLD